METKHTKGNWRNGLEKRRAVVCDRVDGRIVTICSTDISNHIEQEEAVANAKLIASAPELLETLIKLEMLLRLCTNNTPNDGSIIGKHLAEAINAIKKATT